MKDLERFVDWKRIRTIIDCGANVGKWSKFALKASKGQAQIYAFEPNPSVALGWMQWANRHGVNLGIQALGEKTDEVDFAIHLDHPSSSSVLTRTAECVEIYPFCNRVEHTRVHMTRLDDALPGDLEPEILIKMDCQGYEDRIVEGGLRVFEKAYAVVCEAMLAPLYEDQATFDDLVAMFAELGLKYMGNVTQEYERGRLMFIDAVFRRD